MKLDFEVLVKTIPLILPFALLSACASTPEPEELVVVTPPPLQTCYPIASLEKVVIPQETKTMYSTVSIDSPPEYYTDPNTGETVEIINPPIEQMQEHVIVTKEEEIFYQTPEGEPVTDICELNQEPAPAPAPAPAQ